MKSHMVEHRSCVDITRGAIVNQLAPTNTRTHPMRFFRGDLNRILGESRTVEDSTTKSQANYANKSDQGDTK